MVKNLPANAGDTRDTGSIPGGGRSPGEGHGNPLQYSCLENPMGRGAWWATVHGVAKNQTRLNHRVCAHVCACTHTHTHTPLFKGGVGRRGPEANEEKHPEKKRLARNSHG